MELVKLRDGRQAIRDGDKLLAVPPMHPDIPGDVRLKVYELVLRRQWGAALDVAQEAEDAREHRSGVMASLHALISARPHRGGSGYAAAA